MHLIGASTILRSFSRSIFRAACVAVFVTCLAPVSQFLNAQAPGQWAWTGGSNLRGDDLGVYGNEYQFSAANIPGYRSGAVTWVGTDGRLWLLGGQGNNSAGWGGILNDLWVFEPAQGAHGEWAWMGGDKTYLPNIYGKPGVYGTEYEPAAANIPGSRSQAATWADTKGRLWLFGGEGIDSAGNQGELNDLWVFDSALGTHGEWAWMGGSSTIPTESDCMVHYLLRYPCGPMSTYGNKYQFGAANIPGGRTSAASWTDQTGRLWLFGGAGFSFGGYYLGVTGIGGDLNDLWVFDPGEGPHGEWAWMGGSSELPQTEACTMGVLCGVSGTYGAEYEASATNIPGGRYEAVSWADQAGRLWLFGGVGLDSAGFWGSLNDLWVFDPAQGAHGEWAWMAGSAIIPQTLGCTGGTSDDCGVSGIYGTEYQFAPKNSPGARFSPVSWTGRDSRLWLFGGAGLDSVGNWGSLNDLWAFDPTRGAHGEWAWMGGSNVEGQPEAYGTEYRFAGSNMPGSSELAVSWTGQDDSFWLFGGFGNPNDLWEYKVGAQSITFPQPASPVIYSVKPIDLTAKASSGLAVSFASTTPKVCSVAGAKATLLATGSCIIEAAQRGNASYIAAEPVSRTISVKPAGTVATPVIKPGTGTHTVKQTVTITDSTTGAAIYYSVDGSTPSSTHGTRYETAFTAGHSETVKAIAVKAGYLKSAVATSALTIQ